MADLKTLSQWKDDFAKKSHVQPQDHERVNEGAYLSGESAVIVSGPPVLTSEFGDFIPIGLVQAAQVNQRKQLNELFEIGGRQSFFVPSRNQVVASLSRILFDGPSLFYALYKRSFAEGGQVQIPQAGSFGGDETSPLNTPTSPYPGGEDFQAVDNINRDDPSDNNPGFFWSNLGSAIFNRPLGIGFVLYNMNGQAYGGTYLERCYIETHSFGISANATVLAENVNLRASRVRPLNAANISDRGVE